MAETLDDLQPHYHVIKNDEDPRLADARYKEYRALWEKTAIAHLITPFPLHLDIEVTSYCNLKCSMCPRTHRVKNGEWENRHMTFDIFKGIIDEGAAHGLCAINLNNFGESLLNPSLCRMIRYAKKKGIIDIMLHTNGTLLNNGLSQELLETGLDTIVFSVDGITKTVYEKIRHGASFEKTISGIRDFCRMKKEKGIKAPHIRVNMVVMKENREEQAGFRSFWGDDVDSVSFVDYRNQDGLDGRDRYVTKRAGNLGYACPSLWQRMTIHVTGQVTACCRDAGKLLMIGHLEEDRSLKAIWNGPVLKRVRSKHEKGEAWKIKACYGCDHIRGYQSPINM